MNRVAIACLLGFVMLATTIAYIGRYDISPLVEARFLITDRWTGTVSVCVMLLPYSRCWTVYPARDYVAPVAAKEDPPLTEEEIEKILGPRPANKH